MRQIADNWVQQLDRHFKPYAQHERRGYSITVCIPYPAYGFALCIRIADPRIQRDFAPVQQELEQLAAATLQADQPRPFAVGTLSPAGFSLPVAFTAGLTAIGIHWTTDTIYAALFGGIVAACLTSLYDGWQTYREMTQAARDAETVANQFRANGPPPEASPLPVSDRRLLTAAIGYRPAAEPSHA